ncbi:neutral ceramidase-like isoform X2 [Panonychus citri]|uniref:neutral ceramidase-like isoform X2 n=1 Tax=Panonychus citri TaxID=50023 RepID=UPI002306F47D|nr:neutral ceramidase-like isoform X2 [Panonychus citri]
MDTPENKASIFCNNQNSDQSDDDVYLLGVGIADVTGPAAEVNMMGYAKLGQDSGGIHFRLFSRAFIVEDSSGNRVVFVSADVCMIDQAVKTQVVARLQEKYGDLYNIDNVLISGTHTHSGPGGFLQYLLYTITAQGFNWQSFNAVVDGIVRSIQRAHSCIRKGHIYYNQGLLFNASINRSPSAYLNNSEEERKNYPHDTDKEMHLLKFVDTKERPLGLITWFAVHPTSMNNTNSLISGDNKGYASLLTESHINNALNESEINLPGHGPFVAAFAATNLGDVSPNIKGPHCADTGLPCDIQTSTCGGKNGNCFAVGPGKDMFESTAIIGERQYEKAIELFEGASEKVSGPVKFVHQHVDMTSIEIEQPDGTIARTCKPAMGYSFAAGTIDGPGAFDFKQGTTTSNLFWNLVRDFISKPSQDLIDCHQPKPILLATGQMNFPYPWQPSIVPLQIIQIGNIVITGAPGEFTTMSGRRLRSKIGQILNQSNENIIRDDENEIRYHVILAGLSNAYSSYVATPEEYQVQRYEGASTIYGPHTLDAYLLKFGLLAQNLVDGTTPEPGPEPPNLLNRQISLRPGVVFDSTPPGKHFGDCILQPADVYTPGSTVVVRFASGHPRNDLMTEKSFLTVEKLIDEKNNTFQVISTDSSLDTKFFWKRTNSILGHSEAIISWEIPLDVKPGTYRIRHFGSSKNFLQSIKSYSGQTELFKVNDKL